jgi:hypothetical protein
MTKLLRHEIVSTFLLAYCWLASLLVLLASIRAIREATYWGCLIYLALGIVSSVVTVRFTYKSHGTPVLDFFSICSVLFVDMVIARTFAASSSLATVDSGIVFVVCIVALLAATRRIPSNHSIEKTFNSERPFPIGIKTSFKSGVSIRRRRLTAISDF